jgi:3-hydroxybutyryl-CoA dehydrogenase
MQPSHASVIGICGSGQMGASAAALFSRAGHRVIVWSRSPEKFPAVADSLDRMSGFLTEHFGKAALAPGAIELTADQHSINDGADFVLECIAEQLDAKCQVLAELAPAAGRGAVLMSCTSGLSIEAMGRRSGQGRRLVGAHFWNPPHLMPVVEVIGGPETDPGLTASVSTLMRRVGKIPIICRDVPGFIGNRLLHALFREAISLVQQGICSAADVDTVTRLTFALRLPALGPCENIDLVGLPLVAEIQSYLLQDLSAAETTMPILRQMIADGSTGMSAGRGFYEWSAEMAAQRIEQRDRQIVDQLQRLRAMGRIPCTDQDAAADACVSGSNQR